jgi:hypothetical protein
MAGFALATAVLYRSLRALVPVFSQFPVNKLANSVLLLNEYGKSFAFVSKKKGRIYSRGCLTRGKEPGSFVIFFCFLQWWLSPVGYDRLDYFSQK